MGKSGLLSRLIFATAVAVVGLFLLQVLFVLIRHEHYFWDFDVYYTAASALWAGENPYTATHPDHPFRYVYPLVSLLFFEPLLVFGPVVAPVVHFVFQLAVLLLLWRHFVKDYVGNSERALFTIFFVLAFNSSISSGLRAGNVAVMEAALVWSALAFYLRGRLLPFTMLVVFSAFFKIVTILLLGLLIFGNERRRWGLLIGGSGAFAATIGLSSLAFPDWHRQMVDNITLLGDASRGALNPSLREFFEDLTELSGLPNLYLVAVTSIAAVTAWRIFSLSDRRLRVMLYVVSMCLVLPRLKDYSYAVLILPVYYIVMRVNHNVLRWMLLAVAIIPTHYLSRYLFGIPDEQALRSILFLFWEYTPLVVLAVAWTYHVAVLSAQQVRVGSQVENCSS